jgi:hypothetical protein
MQFNDAKAPLHKSGAAVWTESHKSLLISITSPFFVHRMFVGGLGLWETMHVRLIVDSLSMNISGEPIILVTGSARVNCLWSWCEGKFQLN